MVFEKLNITIINFAFTENLVLKFLFVLIINEVLLN